MSTPILDPPRGAARPLAALVRWYQIARAGRPSPCRYVPSCSTYAAEALRTHGAVRGSAFALRRLCRCHPWGGHGYDPVPERAERIAQAARQSRSRGSRSWRLRRRAARATPAPVGAGSEKKATR